MRKEYLRLYSEIDNQLPRECGNCGSKCDLTIHHIVPITFGGTNRLTNLVRLCTVCHSKAHGGMTFIDKAKDVMRDKAAKGERTLGAIPLGYKYEGNQFVINEEEAEVVRFIFRMRYKREYSTTNIAKTLTHMAIPTQRGAKERSHPTVKRILENVKYFGEYVFDGKSYGQALPPILDEETKESIRAFEDKYRGKRVPPKILI